MSDLDEMLAAIHRKHDRFDTLRKRLSETLRALDQQWADDLPMAALSFAQRLETTLGELKQFLSEEGETWRTRNAYCGICGHPFYAFINREPRCVACYDRALDIAENFQA